MFLVPGFSLTSQEQVDALRCACQRQNWSKQPEGLCDCGMKNKEQEAQHFRETSQEWQLLVFPIYLSFLG